MLIIGITGTYGAGKGTVVEYLKTKGFEHYSVSGYLLELVEEAGWGKNRDSLIKMGNELRKKYGPGYTVEQLYLKAEKIGNNTIIESIRTMGEIESLRSYGNFFLVGVDADRKLRYDRAQIRQSLKDSVSYEDFCKSEDNESVSNDTGVQNLAKCMEAADYRIENNGSIEDLNKKIDEFIEFINKQNESTKK